MVPFLGYVVVAGVALALAARGAASAALVIWALGFLVLFAGDNIVRPMLVGGAIQQMKPGR
jgi:predicted PurR-regulated permease PerM